MLRPIQAERIPEVWSNQFSRQSSYEGGKFVSLGTGRLYHRPPPQCEAIRTAHHVTRHNTPIHNILSTAP
jgi:hypothetical protein